MTKLEECHLCPHKICTDIGTLPDCDRNVRTVMETQPIAHFFIAVGAIKDCWLRKKKADTTMIDFRKAWKDRYEEEADK